MRWLLAIVLLAGCAEEKRWWEADRIPLPLACQLLRSNRTDMLACRENYHAGRGCEVINYTPDDGFDFVIVCPDEDQT